jgi:hypothetical protein
MMLYRLAHWTLPRSFRTTNGELPLWFIGVTGIVTGVLTFLLEAAGFWLIHGISPGMVLQVDFTFDAGIRPGWYVLGAGLIFFLIGVWRLAPAGGWLQLATSKSAGRTPS